MGGWQALHAQGGHPGERPPLLNPTSHYLDPPPIMRTSAVGRAIAGITAVFLASAIGLASMIGLTPGIMSVEPDPHMPDALARDPVRNVTVPITVTAADFQLSPNTLSMSQPGLITITLANKDKVDHTISITGVDGTLKAPALGSAMTSFQFDRRGTCEIICSIPNHVASGMSATLIVGEQPSADTPNS